MAWVFTDDPNDPCIYCVQWRGLDDPETHEPYWPDGSVVPRVYQHACGKCRITLEQMRNS